jgi:hypothetical protein
LITRIIFGDEYRSCIYRTLNRNRHRHPSRLRPNRPVSASCNSLFKGLPSHLHLVYNSALLLVSCCCSLAQILFILITCCSQFDLYLRSLSSAGFAFNNYKISVFLLWSRSVYPAVLLKKLISIDVSHFFILLPEGPNFASMGRASAFYTFILEYFWTKVGLKVLFRIHSILANFANFC